MNDPKDKIIVITIALSVGALLGAATITTSSPYIDLALELRKECQADLPRNQFCIMQYVPEEKK